jgi:hypothetical protein
VFSLCIWTNKIYFNKPHLRVSKGELPHSWFTADVNSKENQVKFTKFYTRKCMKIDALVPQYFVHWDNVFIVHTLQYYQILQMLFWPLDIHINFTTSGQNRIVCVCIYLSIYLYIYIYIYIYIKPRTTSNFLLRYNPSKSLSHIHTYIHACMCTHTWN